MSKSTPVVMRMAKILDFISENSSRDFTYTEIARGTRLSPSTCHMFLVGLHEIGYLQKQGDNTYKLGPAFIAISQIAAQR